MIPHRHLLAALAATSLVAIGIVAPQPAWAGSVVRVWDAPVLLDSHMPSRFAPAATAAHGTQAAAVWVMGGHVWLTERSVATEVWSAKQDLGTTTGSADVAYGSDGTLAVAFGVNDGLYDNVRLLTRAPGALSFVGTERVPGDEPGPVVGIQVVVSDAASGATPARATVAWVRSGPTGVLRVATPTARAGTLQVVFESGPGPISRFRLVQQGSTPPLLVWLGDTLKPNARVQVLARGIGINAWPLAAAATSVSPASASVKDFAVSGAVDGTTVLAYKVAATDPVPGLFTSTRSAAHVWSVPAHVGGSGAMVSGGSIAAGVGGAAILAWRNIDGGGASTMWVSDRASSSVAWPAAHLLDYLCVACADEPVSDPDVARGPDGSGLIMWNGYGATNGSTAAFVGRGTSWVEQGGIVSNDTAGPGRPLVLADGTTVVFGSGVDAVDFANNILQVREGHLRTTGPSPAGPAVLAGTARVGGRLGCGAPAFAPTPATRAYAWLRNGAVIAGATAAAYTAVAADLGKALQCRVTAAITGPLAGSTAVLSNAVVIALGLAPTPTAGSVAVLGVHRAGVVQTCRVGTWSPAATYVHTFRWLRDGAVISGATASTFLPPAALRAHTLACRVTSSRAGYATGTATSAAVPVA